MAGRSIIEYFPDSNGYKCGYCGSEDTSLSHGMWVHTMTVQDYQDLIDRGFRRSGKYCYKPTMDKTCCPQYAIRCEIKNFKPNKSHKKVIKRVNRYLNTGQKSEKNEKDDLGKDPPEGAEDVPPGGGIGIPSEKLEGRSLSYAADLLKGQAVTESHQKEDNNVKTPEASVSSTQDKSGCKGQKAHIKPNPKRTPRPGDGADASRPNCKKAKVIRMEHKQKKLESKGTIVSQVPEKHKSNEGKSLEEFLLDVKDDPAHKLELRLVRSSSRSKEFKESFEESYSVYKKYQMAIHGDPPDKPTVSQYTRFLVDSPLQAEHNEGGFEEGFGSFHQQYWLDGKLIAVGVLDILPMCVSSVYLYYDPDYYFLSLGTYSALREIEFIRQINTREPKIEFYYLGYYIQSCPKMKYKGQYSPSFLLCPESYTWNPIEKCRPLLDASKYSRLDDTDKVDVDGDIDLDQVLVLHRNQAMPYMIYKALNPDTDGDDDDEVKQYAHFTGKRCAERMLLFRS